MGVERNTPRALRLAGLTLVGLSLILVPFAVLGRGMETWAEGALSGTPGPSVSVALLVAGLLAADIVLPTPSSVVSTAAGAILGFGWGALASWAGMTVGCVVGYWAGSAGRGVALRVAREEDLRAVETLMRRFGPWTLALARAVPVLAEASVVTAGLARQDRRSFLLITALSNAGISAAYAAIGARSAEVDSFLLAFAGATLLPLLAYGVVRLLRRGGPVGPVRTPDPPAPRGSVGTRP